MRILITSGGTKIPIDDVRSITNMSKGTFGAQLATAALEVGGKVEFLKSKNSVTPFTIQGTVNAPYGTSSLLRQIADRSQLWDIHHKNYDEYEYDSFKEYSRSLENLVTRLKPPIVILAAAVSDYGTTPIAGKARSREGDMTIKLEPLPKLISQIKKWSPDTTLVGFKLLVNSTDEELIGAAKKSISDNGCDLVVANDLRDIKNNNHRLIIVSKYGGISVYRKTDNEDSLYLANSVITQAQMSRK